MRCRGCAKSRLVLQDLEVGTEPMIRGTFDSEALIYEESIKCSPESHNLDTTGKADAHLMLSGVQEAT